VSGSDIVVGGVTQMSYGITNRVMVRKDSDGQPQAGAPRELLNVSVRQSHYTDANASKFDNSYSYGYNSRPPNAFSPISLTARAMPTMPVAIDYRLEYDPLALDTRPLGMSLNGLRAPDVNMTGGWSRQAFTQTTATGADPGEQFVQTSVDFHILQSKSAASWRSTTTSPNRR
jgi:hypothetical protein